MFGSRIKEIREKKNLTAENFASILETSSKTISNYETEKTAPSFIFLEKLNKKLNVNTNWLLTGQGKMFIDESNEVKKIINGNNNSVAVGSNNKQNSSTNLSSAVDELTKYILENFKMLNEEHKRQIHFEILTKLKEEGKI